MSGRFVRASKYRHVFGRPTKKEQCYDNIRVSKNAWDSNIVKANSQYLSVNWDASGGGAFAVIPLQEKGRLPESIPLFRGHTAVVLDTDWHPFNDRIVCSGSDDGKAFIWKVPEGFSLYTDAEEVTDVAPVAKLTGHSRKIGHVLFNPSAENVLATASGDFTIKVWDIEAGAPRLTLKHSDIVQSLSWSANGGLMVTTSRDKKLRIWDVRQEQPVHVGPGHAGAKNSRAVWMGEHDRVATTGFSKMSDRQLGLWDIRSAGEPIGGFDMLDSISGVCMPFWDDSTRMLYLAGKGDGNIRYFEYENDKFEFLSEYKSADPQRGLAFLPKRALNVHENEVMRAFKTVNDSYIEPVSFIVPRRAEVFQGDIYPPVPGARPGATAAQWLGGADALPPKIDLESVYAGQEPVEVPSDYKPPPPLTPMPPPPEPRKAEPPAAKTESVPPTPATARGPPPSMKEQGASMASMASKFADPKEKPEDEDEDEDSSSFEEVPQPPAPRQAAAAQSPVKAKSGLQDYEHVAPPAAAAREEKAPASETSKAANSDSGQARTPQPSSQKIQSLQAELSQQNALLKQNNALMEQMSQAMQQQYEVVLKLAAEVKSLQHERE